MSYGIFICGARPKTKKAVKEAVQKGNEESGGNFRVVLENTSMFGGYDGSITNAPDGDYHFVGPDPYNSRKFYGTLTVRAGKATVK